MRDPNRLLTAFAAALLLAPLVVGADDKDKDFDRSPVDCISVSRIDKTDIVDDQTILFFMRGGKQIYRNYLPHRCPNLEVEDRFGYHVSSGRLCRIDLIRVLPRIGFPLSCQLGQFVPISAEEVDELRAIHDKGRRGDGVEAKPAEPQKKGDDDAAR